MKFHDKGTNNVPQNQVLEQKSCLNVTVSIYKNYTDNIGKQCNLLTFLTTSKYKEKVEIIRTYTDKKVINATKAQLPCVTVSALFHEKRGLELPNTPTGLICLDFDNIEDIPALFALLSETPFVAFAGLSVSGKGVFAVIPIENPKNLIGHYFALERYFYECGYAIDKACKDLTRLRGATYNETPYINHEATIFADFDVISSLTTLTAPTSATSATSANTPPAPTSSEVLDYVLNAAYKDNQEFTDGKRTHYVCFVSGLFNRLGIEKNAAFELISSVIDIRNYPEQAHRFFDIYKRYAHEFNSTRFSRSLKGKFEPLHTHPKETIEYEKYLSDSRDFEAISRKILASDCRFFQVLGLTRAGKSFAYTRTFVDIVIRLCHDKKVIFVNPLRTPTEQLANGTTLNTDINTFEHSIFTWDKCLLFLNKHRCNLKNCIVIIDECHDLIKASYKSRQIAQLYTYFPFLFKVIGLSGTPFGVFEWLGFETISAQSKIAFDYHSEVITTEFDNISTELISLLQAKKALNEKSLVFCTSATSPKSTSAESLAKLGKKCGLVCDFVFSGNKTTNETSLHIQNERCLPQDVDVCFCTAVFESGLTLEVDNVIYINDKASVDFVGIWQSLSRNTTVKKRNIYAITIPIAEKKHPQFDFDIKKFNKDFVDKCKFADLYTSQKELIVNNNCFKRYKLPSIQDNSIVWSDLERKYIVCPFVLLSEQYPNITKSYTHNDLVSFLEDATKSTVIHYDKTHAPENVEIQDITAQIAVETKAIQSMDKILISEMLQNENDSIDFLCGVFKLTGDNNLKRSLMANGYGQMPETPAVVKELHFRSTKICENAANRYTYLKKVFLGAISVENISQWSVTNAYNYGIVLKQLSYIATRILIKCYGEEKLVLLIHDARAPQKIAAINAKFRCLHALYDAFFDGKNIDWANLESAEDVPKFIMPINQVFEIVRKFEPKITKKGLSAYLNTFCYANITQKNKAIFYVINDFDFDAFLDTNIYLKNFELLPLYMYGE